MSLAQGGLKTKIYEHMRREIVQVNNADILLDTYPDSKNSIDLWLWAHWNVAKTRKGWIAHETYIGNTFEKFVRSKSSNAAAYSGRRRRVPSKWYIICLLWIRAFECSTRTVCATKVGGWWRRWQHSKYGAQCSQFIVIRRRQYKQRRGSRAWHRKKLVRVA